MTRQTLLIVVAVLLGGYAFGSCHAVRDSRDHVLEANAYKLSRSLPAKRAQHTAELLAADSARTARGRTEERVEVADQTLALQVDSLRAMLASNAYTKEQLAAQIRPLLDSVTTFRAKVQDLRDSLNAESQASLRERYAAQRLQATTDSTAQAFKTLYENEKCTGCPSRKTTALITFAGTVIIVLLLL